MSTIKLGSAKELEKFLKILAEESVSLAKSEPERQKMMQKKIKSDLKSLTEEDPEEPSDAPPSQPADKKPATPQPDAAKDDPAPQAPKPTQTATPSEVPASELNPTLSSLIDAIKDMRGGRGASDSAVEAELTSYFDRLDDAERVALIVMMRSIGNIMRQQQTGAEAPEPEQYDILTTRKPSEKGSAPIKGEKSSPAPAASAPAGEEDTAPPIKVGEPVSESYRAKIRDLLSRTR